MMIFICESCHDGFDIECSGGIACPECGGGRWKQIYHLPEKANSYRTAWAKLYGEYPLNEGEEIPEIYRETEDGQ